MPQPSLLLTRPRPAAEAFLARLSPALHARAVISPLISIVPTHTEPDLTGYAGVIFTSANAVVHGPKGDGRLAFCVGPQTTQAAHDAGWQAKMAGLTAAAMIAALARRADLGPLLHLAGEHRRGDVAGVLSGAGLKVDVVTLYVQDLLPLSDEAQALLKGGAPVLVPLFSPRSAQQFARSAARTEGVLAVSISTATARAIQGLPLSAQEVAREPTGAAMAEAVEKLFRRTTLP